MPEQPPGPKRCPACGRLALPKQSRCLFCNARLNEPARAALAAETAELAPWLAEVADRFRAAWKQTPRPRIEDVLLACPVPRQAELLRALLGIELELRYNDGEAPVPEQYLERFPAHGSLVRQVLEAERQRDHAPAAAPGHGPRTTAPAAPEPKPPDPIRTQAQSTVAQETAPVEPPEPPPPAVPSPETVDHIPASESVEKSPGGPPDLPPQPPPSAYRIGRFEIRVLLGQGAFGRVYRAYDPQLDREVALKVAKPGLLASRSGLERFLREARAAAQLRHPNVVPVFDAGRDGDQPYIASAFIAGRTLEALLDEGPVPLRRAAQIVRQLADALDYAHDQGVVHRDVKPANVMIDDRGQALLADFGLAARAEAERLTQEGMIVGTPLYLAPEQADPRGGGPLLASDQYSLGVVLYELLTGRPPFHGTVQVVIYHHRHTEPDPPRRHNPQVPLDLETICLKALAKAPPDRYAGCYQLANDLRRWLEDEPIKARRLSPAERFVRWCKRDPWIAGASAAVVLLLVALGVVQQVYATRAEREAQTTRNALVRLEAETTAKEAADAEREKEATARQHEARLKEEALARALRTAGAVAYVRTLAEARHEVQSGKRAEAQRLLDECPADLRGWEWCLLRRANGRGTESPLPGSAQPVEAAAFSPDGLLLAYGAGPEIKLLEAGSRREVATFRADGGAVRGLAFSPDGRRLASAAGKVQVWEVPGGKESLALEADGRPYVLAWSAESNRLVAAFELASSHVLTDRNNRVLRQGRGGSLRVWDMRDGRQLHEVSNPHGRVTALALSPSGSRLAQVQELQDQVTLWDVETAKPAADFKAPAEKALALAFSPDGRYLAGACDTRIKVWDADTGKEVQVLAGHREAVACLAFSPDGRRLASAGQDHTVKTWDTEMGQETLALDGPAGAALCLAFSPDGKRLAVGGGQPKKAGELQLWDADLEPHALTLRGHADWVSDAAFSPDGKLVASASSDRTVWLWDAATGRIVRRLPPQEAAVSRVVFSPDGRQLATGTGEWTNWVRHPSGKKLWRRDRPRTPGTVSLWDVATGDLVRSVQGSADTIFTLAFGPDGRYLACGSVSLEEKSVEEVREVPVENPRREVDLNLDPFKTMSPGFPTTPSYDPFPAARPRVPDVQIPGMNRPRMDPRTGMPEGLGQPPPAPPKYVTVRRWYTEVTGQLTAHDLAGGGTVPGFARLKSTLFSVARSADGQRLATGDSAGGVRVWDAATGQELVALPQQPYQVVSVALSPDGTRLAFAASEAQVWDVSGEKPKQVFAAGKAVHAVAFTPDGRGVVAGDAAGGITVWEAVTGEGRRSFKAHDDAVTSLAVAADGRMVSSSFDQTVKIWDRSRTEAAASDDPPEP